MLFIRFANHILELQQSSLNALDHLTALTYSITFSRYKTKQKIRLLIRNLYYCMSGNAKDLNNNHIQLLFTTSTNHKKIPMF